MTPRHTPPLLIRAPESLTPLLEAAAGQPHTAGGAHPLTLELRPLDRADASPPHVQEPHLTVHHHIEGTLVCTPSGHLLLHHDLRTLSLTPTLASGPQPLHTRGAILRMGLALAATHHGALVLHAALVRHPTLGTTLIAGGSGAGKTTTTAALLADGASPITDEISLLLDNPQTTLTGWPSPCHADPYTASLLRSWGIPLPPSTERLPWRATAWFPAPPSMHAQPPCTLILPRINPDAPTAAERLPTAAALAELLYASPLLPLLAPGPSADLHQRAADLLRQCTPWRLHLGNDLPEHPERVRLALDGPHPSRLSD